MKYAEFIDFGDSAKLVTRWHTVNWFKSPYDVWTHKN
jgi:hypothetical protein